MNGLRRALLLGCLLAACVTGCKNPPTPEITYDERGWGGLNLKCELGPEGGPIRIDRGVLISRDFRWADSAFSLEFKDARELVWGFVLVDAVFERGRDQMLKTTMVKIGHKRFEPGARLSLVDRWTFDRVAEVQFRLGDARQSYKVLRAWWDNKILDDGRKGTVRVFGAPQNVGIKRDDWNTLRVAITRGALSYTLNGVSCGDRQQLQLDPRTNGQLGIFVVQGGPLHLRNIRLGR